MFKQTKIKFLRYKIPAMLISVIIISAGIILIWKKGLRYAVDFSGGTAIHIKLRNEVSPDIIRSQLNKNGFPNSGVQAFNDPTQFLIRLPQTPRSEKETQIFAERIARILTVDRTQSDRLKDINSASIMELREVLMVKNPWKTSDPHRYDDELSKVSQLRNANAGLLPFFEDAEEIHPDVLTVLKDHYFVSDLAILSTEYVGPQVGSELRNQAKIAILWSLVGLLIYVSFRFQFLWGMSAIICLAHDVLITLSFFALTGREISLTVVAAFLAILGFSLNDTIVIYDRVRDNLKSMRTQPLENVITLSLNQMLNRTILTNGTIVVVTFVLYVFGGEVINDFAFALLIGAISGTYSTIYVASAIIVFYENLFLKRKRIPVKLLS